MKKLLILMAVMALLASGCAKESPEQEQSLINPDANQTEAVEESVDSEADNENSGESESEEASAGQSEDAGSQYDPEAALKASLALQTSIDIKSTDADIDEITLEPETESWEPRIIKQYVKDGQLLKMTVTEPTDSGKMSGLTSFYYDEGELFMIASDFANYVFDGGTLRIWTDENHRILDMSDADLQRRQEVLVEYLIGYLEMFEYGNK